MKPMEKLSYEEMDKLTLMFEIAPRLADTYRPKNEFLKRLSHTLCKPPVWCIIGTQHWRI